MENKPKYIRIPGLKQQIGLGTVVKRAMQSLGVKPCSSCQKRAEALDRRIVFTGGNRERS